MESHFHKDSVNPHNYDLILNVARFGVDSSATIIVKALEALRTNAPAVANSGA